jgi:hypothetical protein
LENGKKHPDTKGQNHHKEDHLMDESGNEQHSDLESGAEQPGNGSMGEMVTKLPSRVAHAVRGGVGTVAGTVSTKAETIADTVGHQSTAAARKVSSGSKVAVRQAQNNALYVTLGLFALGFALGAFVPRWVARRGHDV